MIGFVVSDIGKCDLFQDRKFFDHIDYSDQNLNVSRQFSQTKSVILTFQLKSGVGFIAKILQISHLYHLRKWNFCNISCIIELVISEKILKSLILISKLLNFIGLIT